MSTTLTFSNLERGPFTPQTGPSIGPNIPDAYQIIIQTDGTRFYCIGSLKYAAVCWKIACPMLPNNNPFDATLSCDLMFDDASATGMQAWELDMMSSNSKGNVGNGSGELQIPSGGIWQVINAGAWTNVPNFVPKLPVANVWTPVRASHHFDPAKELSTFNGCTVGGSVAVGSFPPQPFVPLQWGPNQLVVQVQPNLGPNGGAVSFKIRNLTLTVVYA